MLVLNSLPFCQGYIENSTEWFYGIIYFLYLQFSFLNFWDVPTNFEVLENQVKVKMTELFRDEGRILSLGGRLFRSIDTS